MHYSNFLIFSSWKRAKPFVWTNLNPLHLRMLCAKFGWTWPSCSGEDDFSNLLMYFRNFEIISPWIRNGPSFEQTWIPFTQGYFVPSLVEIDPVVLEKKIFQICQCISQFRNYLSLEKGEALHLNKIESPSPKDALCPVWLKLAQWFWRRRWKCEKFTTTMTTTTMKTDNGQILISIMNLALKRMAQLQTVNKTYCNVT